MFVIQVAFAKHYVTTQNVDVRDGDGTDYPETGMLKEGTIIDADDVSGAWTKIKYEGREGYIASEFLKDPSENNTGTTEVAGIEMSRDTQIILGVVAFLIFLVVLKKLYEWRKNLSAKRSKKNSGANKYKPSYWYQCEVCRAVVRNATAPNTIGCSLTTDHRWNKLGEIGVNKYLCKKCSTSVKLREEPVSNGCLEGGIHEWNVLS